MKVVAWIIGLLVLVVVGAGVYLVLNSGSLVKQAIEELGPGYLGTGVSVEAVDLSLAEGSAQINNLEIENPPGFEGTHAMKLGSVKVALDTDRTTDTLVVMKQVLIDGADLAAVARGRDTNIQKIMDNLDSSAGGESSSSAGDAGAEVKYIVEQFAFTNAKASLDSDLVGQIALPLPDIRLQDVGARSNGATAAELAQQLFEPISKSVRKAVVDAGKKRAVEEAKGKLKDKLGEKLGSGLKGLLDK